MNYAKFLKSFKYALDGLTAFYRKEQNIKVHSFFFVAVAAAIIILKIKFEQAIILLCLSFLIPGLEIINGLVEEVANLLNLPYDRTTYLRNLAAGLVLWASLGAAVIGILIIFKYI